KQKGDEGFVEIERIPLDDMATFDLIKTGRTTGVFQLESSGMQNLIVRLKPDCFEDIIALVALFRPGPLESGMVDNFIARKHGREQVSYPDAQYQHMSLQPILESTYGIILYQEQVMQIAQVLAGYTLGGADMLRRAMGKKKPEEMAKQRSVFEEGAIKNGVDGDLAMKIFDLVEKFAGYGFNKSHSAAYALVSYQSAWLKTHYPAEFMAAQISSDMDNTDKVVHMVNECYQMGLQIDAPDINLGQIHFKAVKGERRLRYGLGAIKGVGESALEGMIQEREQNGSFKDLFDFCMRVNKKVNKRVIEALVVSGAFDGLHDNRNAMLASIGMALQKAEQKQKDEEAGQADLFGDSAAFESENASELVKINEMPEKQRLKAEKDVLGLYLSGHPIAAYREELSKLVDANLADLKPEKWAKKWVAGLIVESRAKVTKSGSKMGFVSLDDQTARLEVVLRPAVFESSREILEPDNIVMVYGEISEDTFNGGIKLDAEQVVTLAESRIEKARAIKVLVHKPMNVSEIHELQSIMLPSRSEQGLPLVVDYQNGNAKAQLISQEGFIYYPDDALLEALKSNGWQAEIVL
ncbi:MAG: DNA polymerase III subunit alpha, partial [Thiotrichales bacterium]|nr:DNA polymerase III subunit alpha [Thiotrichales bacterium]